MIKLAGYPEKIGDGKYHDFPSFLFTGVMGCLVSF